MDESHQILLKDHMVALVTDLDPTEVYAHLIQGDVLSTDDVELINAQTTRRNKALELVSILPRKGLAAFAVFMEALKKTQPHLHQLLLEGARSSYNASADIFADVRRELKGRYTSCLKDIYTAPWLQEFPLDLNEVYVRLRLQSTSGLHNQVDEITQAEIFVPHQKLKNATRILVEGDPGMGKSTLCQKLAHSWSVDSSGEQCCSPCIHSFELVIYLTAANFRGYKDVASVIHAHLLPKDSQISENAVSKALRNRNVLFIVDSYDEACTENPLLRDLILRKREVQSTILLTSRPNYLREMLRCFDTKLYIDGFDVQQRREYVKKFAKHAERPLAELQYLLEERNEFADLCCTPLNMAIVCLMSTMDNTSVSTRTKLYQSVHEFILKKASDRLSLSREDIERTIIDPLCMLSFEAYMKGEAVLMEEDFKKVSSDPELFCQSGYLIKRLKVSLLCGEIRFSFSHRTFQEFLSALFIKRLSVAERQEWLNAVDLEQNESVISFLFGMLKDNEEAILPIASSIIDRTFFSFVNPFNRDSYVIMSEKCPESHLLLCCLCELKTMPPKLEYVISRNCPTVISLHWNCSLNCTKSISTIFSLSNLEQNSISLIIYIRPYMLNEIITMLHHLTKCKSVNRVTLVWPDDESLSRLLDVMQVGRIHSFIQRVKIDQPETYAGKSFKDLSFEGRTRGMELRNNPNTNLSLSFLRAAQSKPLTTFGIAKSELNDECFELISTVLENPLLQNVSVRPPKAHRTKLISLLADLKDLRSVEIDVSDMNKEDWVNFGRLLQNQTLQKLTLIRCDFSKEICDVLSHHFQTMTFLKNIRFKYRQITDSEGFGKVLYAALDLQTLIIDDFQLNGEAVDVLCEVLPKLATLKALRLSLLTFGSDENSDSYLEAYKTAQEQHTQPPSPRIVALRRLIEAIGQCKCLEFLSLRDIDMNIGDDVEELCRAVTSLKQLKYLRLRFHALPEIAITQISECLKLKPGKRVFFENS